MGFLNFEIGRLNCEMQFSVLCACAVIIGKSWVLACGEAASPSLIHQTPWLVYLEYYFRGMPADTRCGGTLISSKHVLTAAHCVRNSEYIKMKARLGEYDVTTVTDCVGGVCSSGVVRIDVVEVFVHHGYDKTEHDIAILKLDKDAPYTDFIRPVCLPTGQLDDNTIFLASGWGEIARGVNSQTTKDILLPLFPIEECRNAYTITLAKNIICAGGEKGKDTCRGDSGGPLAVIKDKVEIWGITSSGYTECGTEGKPGIYTSVMDHLDWIQKIMSQ